jgi:tripartite-type tricarboxylate transporter receptor subunit TctC
LSRQAADERRYAPAATRRNFQETLMGRTTLAFVLALTAAGFSTGAWAQAKGKDPVYPIKPIRFVVPFPAGGTPDIQARMLAEPLAQRLGQPVVIDNRGGAGGILGMEIAARAPADGYTIVTATVGAWAVTPHLYKLQYHVLKDFAPVIQVATTPGVMVVHPSVPVKSVKDLIALAREKPGALNYASGGAGGFSHISAELFKYLAKVSMTDIQYKGAAPAMAGLLGGHTQVMFNTALTTLPHVKAGKLRALAATGAKRMESMPELPTVAEAGVPGYENVSWTGIAAPAGTPPAIVARLNKELAAILAQPDVRQKHEAAGSSIAGGTPKAFQDYLRSEYAKFGKLIKEAGIRVQTGG